MNSPFPVGPFCAQVLGAARESRASSRPWAHTLSLSIDACLPPSLSLLPRTHSFLSSAQLGLSSDNVRGQLSGQQVEDNYRTIMDILKVIFSKF